MWKPTTEAQILIAIDDGNIVENHSLDAKAIIGDTKGDRKNTAQDLASFAIDGGALIVGVSEDRDGVFSAEPFEINRDVERVEQIAANLIDPPLFIRVAEIPSLEHDGKGYLFVEVPPSPQAPHMVSGAYYARGERTTRRLTDSEVLRLHARREDEHEKVRTELQKAIERDPFPVDERKHSHFYFAAEPRATHATAATKLVRHSDKSKMREFLWRSEDHFVSGLSAWEPGPRSVPFYLPRSSGSAFSTLQNGTWNPQQHQEDDWVDIEIRENAGIVAAVGRGSDGQRQILEGIAVAYVLRLLYWAREVSDEIGYRGSWDFAVGGTGLRGMSAYGPGQRGNAGQSRYDVDSYDESTSAHYFEIVESPGVVAGRLVGRLLRGLGVEELYADELH